MKHVRLIEYHITNHCNLNCKGCAHFAPLSQEWFANVDEFIKDLKQLSSKVIIDNLRIFGGEPLLHPQLRLFMHNARSILPQCNISVLTNGILVLQKMKELSNSFINDNIILELTRYPINVDYNDIMKLLNCIHIKTKIENNFEPVKTLRKHILNHIKQDNSFECCMIESQSVQLKHGKLYICPIQAYIEIFNNYYHDNFKVDDSDTLNIYDNISDDDIINFYNKKNSFCKYCRQPIPNLKYALSNKDINEWTNKG